MKFIPPKEFKTTIKITLMDKQTQFKIIQVTHQRDELINQLQDISTELEYENVADIVTKVTKLNKIIKKLSDN